MTIRRHGLLGRGRGTKVIVWLLLASMVGLFSTTYLLEAGMPGWVVILVVLLVLMFPAVLAAMTDTTSKGDRHKR